MSLKRPEGVLNIRDKQIIDKYNSRSRAKMMMQMYRVVCWWSCIQFQVPVLQRYDTNIVVMSGH